MVLSGTKLDNSPSWHKSPLTPGGQRQFPTMPVHPSGQSQPFFHGLHFPPLEQSSQVKLQSLPKVSSKHTGNNRALFLSTFSKLCVFDLCKHIQPWDENFQLCKNERKLFPANDYKTSAPLGPGKLAGAVPSFFHPCCMPSFGLVLHEMGSSSVELQFFCRLQRTVSEAPPAWFPHPEHDPPTQARSQSLRSTWLFLSRRTPAVETSNGVTAEGLTASIGLLTFIKIWGETRTKCCEDGDWLEVSFGRGDEATDLHIGNRKRIRSLGQKGGECVRKQLLGASGSSSSAYFSMAPFVSAALEVTDYRRDFATGKKRGATSTSAFIYDVSWYEDICPARGLKALEALDPRGYHLSTDDRLNTDFHEWIHNPQIQQMASISLKEATNGLKQHLNGHKKIDLLDTFSEKISSSNKKKRKKEQGSVTRAEKQKTNEQVSPLQLLKGMTTPTQSQSITFASLPPPQKGASSYSAVNEDDKLEEPLFLLLSPCRKVTSHHRTIPDSNVPVLGVSALDIECTANLSRAWRW
ncbi:hypothetical protein FQN60_009412 [Etheostoma spectabile]|uniref:Uncharacterized protein n=1 Tax=Etheostoma spectabile TaxID=54343 RepID=A0A5J5DIT2_9PERO|nr:hypothetical protein FQN60_009412 [Etheostoma spectabile]